MTKKSRKTKQKDIILSEISACTSLFTANEFQQNQEKR
jgi:hypothetical protein